MAIGSGSSTSPSPSTISGPTNSRTRSTRRTRNRSSTLTGSNAGHLRAPWRVRHRLPGTRTEHARSQLHPDRRAARRGRQAAAHRSQHQSASSMATTVSYVEISRTEHCFPAPSQGAPRIVAAGSLGSTNCCCAAVTIGRLTATERPAWPQLEQQRRFPDAGAPCRTRRHPDARSNDHGGSRFAGWRVSGAARLHRRRRAAEHRADAARCAGRPNAKVLRRSRAGIDCHCPADVFRRRAQKRHAVVCAKPRRRRRPVVAAGRATVPRLEHAPNRRRPSTPWSRCISKWRCERAECP